MRLTVELPVALDRCLRTRSDGTRYILIGKLPRWYELEIVQSDDQVEKESKKSSPGRPKKDIYDIVEDTSIDKKKEVKDDPGGSGRT